MKAEPRAARVLPCPDEEQRRDHARTLGAARCQAHRPLSRGVEFLQHVLDEGAFLGGVSLVALAVEMQLQRVVLGEQPGVGDQRVAKRSKQRSDADPATTSWTPTGGALLAGLVKLARVGVQLCGWWIAYALLSTATARANSLACTRTSTSRSPFVRAPGTEVAPTCSTSASGRSRSTCSRWW